MSWRVKLTQTCAAASTVHRLSSGKGQVLTTKGRTCICPVPPRLWRGVEDGEPWREPWRLPPTEPPPPQSPPCDEAPPMLEVAVPPEGCGPRAASRACHNVEWRCVTDRGKYCHL